MKWIAQNFPSLGKITLLCMSSFVQYKSTSLWHCKKLEQYKSVTVKNIIVHYKCTVQPKSLPGGLISFIVLPLLSLPVERPEAGQASVGDQAYFAPKSGLLKKIKHLRQFKAAGNFSLQCKVLVYETMVLSKGKTSCTPKQVRPKFFGSFWISQQVESSAAAL